MDNEDIIVKKACEGDEDAFRFLVEKYQKYIYVICLNILKDPHEAENAAQDTFLKIYHSLHQYEFKGFKTWIGRIATRKAIDRYRKISVLSTRESAFTDDILNIRGPDNNYPQNELIEKEDRKRILALCEELPDIYRIIVKKYYVGEMSYQSIADSEGLTVKTVASRLYRAKKMLKEKWEVDD